MLDDHKFILNVYHEDEKILWLTCKTKDNIKKIFVIVWYLFTSNKELWNRFIKRIKEGTKINDTMTIWAMTTDDIDDIIFSQFQDMINFCTSICFEENNVTRMYNELLKQWMRFELSENLLLSGDNITVEDLFK